MSVGSDCATDVGVDIADNTAAVTVTVEVEVPELFDENGELRLWEDSSGWIGYVREETDEGPHYYRVNTRHDDDCWLSKVRVGEQAVTDAVRKHIRDSEAGAIDRALKHYLADRQNKEEVADKLPGKIVQEPIPCLASSQPPSCHYSGHLEFVQGHGVEVLWCRGDGVSGHAESVERIAL